jgi:hypothetical protein
MKRVATIFTILSLLVLCAYTTSFAEGEDSVISQDVEAVEESQAEETTENNSAKEVSDEVVASVPETQTESSESVSKAEETATAITEAATEAVTETAKAKATAESATETVEKAVSDSTSETPTLDSDTTDENPVVHIIKVDGGYVKVIGDVYDANSPTYFTTEYPEVPEGASVVYWDTDPRWEKRDPITVISEIHVIKLPDGTYDIVYGPLDNPFEVEHCDVCPELPEDVPTTYWDEDPRITVTVPEPPKPECPDYSGIVVSIDGNKVTITNAKFRNTKELWLYLRTLDLPFEIDSLVWEGENGIISTVRINADEDIEEDATENEDSNEGTSSAVTVETTETEETEVVSAPKAEKVSEANEEETFAKAEEEPKELPKPNMFLIGDCKTEEKFYADFMKEDEDDDN